MINVLFFGQLKEQLQTGQLSIELPVNDVKALKSALGQRGVLWRECLSGASTLVAINQTIGSDKSTINDGDEVAFFPPVTGG